MARTGRNVAIGLVAALAVWKIVLPMLSFGFGLLGSGLYATTTAAGFTNPDTVTLRSAIRNVTTDYDQLTMVLQEYFEAREGYDGSTCEANFKEFLQKRAVKSRPALENTLDWVLALYKVTWPVLVIMLLSRLNTSRKDKGKPTLVKAQGTLNDVAHNGPAELTRPRTMPPARTPKSPRQRGSLRTHESSPP